MPSDPKFQLVIQFPASLVDDSSTLPAIYDLFEKGLAGDARAFIDGHDYGLGEFNMFIHTNEHIEPIFHKMRPLIEAGYPGVTFSAGYRSFDQEEYTPLWPPTLKSFLVA